MMHWANPQAATWIASTSTSTGTTTSSAICPDLLSIRDLGEAEGWRGHLVRGFFRLLRIVTGL